MKKLIAKLFGLELPKPETVANEHLVIKPVADTDSLNESLGITEQRAKELKKKVFQALHNHPRVSESAAELSKECVHANELFFVTWALSDAIHKMREIGDLMKAFTKDKDEE